MSTPFADYQNEIYLHGALGTPPALPIDWREVRHAAVSQMSATTAAYVEGGAGEESTIAANRAAFERWRIVPRMLRGVPRERDHATTVLGTEMPAPVLLAPIGVLGIVHESAERGAAEGAGRVGLPYVVSTASSTSLEDTMAAGPGPKWFQLYWPTDRELAASFVSRAEQAGYGAIVLTLDTWQLGWRPQDLRTGYLPFLHGEGIANYTSDPVFMEGLTSPQDAVMKFVQVFGNPALTWEDLAWLREQTSLPIVLKGVQHGDDVRRARDAGVQGVICSNHGGRQVDGALASLDALPRLVAAAGDALPVLFDSGVRTGADVVKALSLGAAAVLLGRPYAHGLALAGADGVEHVLRCLLADLDLQVGLSGHASTRELSPVSVREQA